MIATLVHSDELLQTIVASIVAGVGVTFAFSVAIWGVGSFAELSRDGRPVAAAMAGAVAALALLAVAGALIFGIYVMTSS
jgi:hypothetical protein